MKMSEFRMFSSIMCRIEGFMFSQKKEREVDNNNGFPNTSLFLFVTK